MPHQLTFRWNLAQREQLGRLLDGEAPDVDPEFLDHLRHCCARLLAVAGDSTLIFIGRSPESIFDYLSGSFAGTRYRDRCVLLNLSMRHHTVSEVERENAAGLRHLQEQLAAAGFSPRQIARSTRPQTPVDLVYGGSTFSNLVGLLDHWTEQEGEDARAVRRRLRFVGITVRTKNSPNTWRWYQRVEWAHRFPRAALRSVSVPFRFWTYLGDSQAKVSRWHPPRTWGDEYHLSPPREDLTIRALRFAAHLYNLAQTAAERERFARMLTEQHEMNDPWVRQVVLRLRNRAG